ncbi:CYFA0S40e00166g1_1 [Cyberlindnera fabianii]|uniref:CYFA0S40e00166g1_1 n=1 Tax=Cyberlindnera fabianii TaxID=36022 RepID=A0A061BJ50_CYBFA|nr:CYFA0S40e00166g1_1 [Cyberlindnera fabianii]
MFSISFHSFVSRSSRDLKHLPQTMLPTRLLSLLALATVPFVWAEDVGGPDTPKVSEHVELLRTPGIEEQHVIYPYSETLDITPLPRNHMFASFKFDLESEPYNVSQRSPYTHYKAFPRALAPILASTNTRDLHMRFGQGWWDSEHWGQLPDSGVSAGGVGIEVWAVIEAKTKEESFEQWITLVNILSGLFCASLNFIDSSKTIYPVKSFAPSRDIPLFDQESELFLIRASLPSEPVCTENLTPFMKFIPTRGKAGLASLLDGHRIFESEWHMMSIDIETQCSEDQICKLGMKQQIDAVVDVTRALRRKKSQIPKPDQGSDLICDPSKPMDNFQCFPINQKDDMAYSLSDIFGRSINGGSLLSEKPSRVCVHAPEEWSVFLSIGSSNYGTGDNCFDIKNVLEHDVHLDTRASANVNEPKPVPVSVSRSLTGYGQDTGGVRTVFKNNLKDDIHFVYLETLPWFMRIYLHTLTVSGIEDTDNIIRSIFYQPEEDRKRPTHLELEIVIPAESSIVISYSFDKSLLLIAEYPPDANHGFSIEPGTLKVVSPVIYELRTSPALLTLPTPDFSMPYNVIIFTATVMSLSFGTFFNLLFKRTIPEEDTDLLDDVFSPKSKLKGKIQRVKSKIGAKVTSLKVAMGIDKAEVKVETDPEVDEN